MPRVQQESRAYVSLSLAFIAYSLLGCSTNPYTDRPQLLLISESQELQLGAQAYAQVLRDPKVKISQDPREVEPVNRVAKRVIEAAKQSKYAEMAKQFNWQVIVIKDDKTMNAFALPGGKIAVYTGIFPIAKNEAGLAAILGHEVTHALARHGAERMSQGLLTQLGLEAANIALASQGASPIVMQTAMTALGLGANVGVLLPFSRAHESEADYIGLLLAAQAGYDPREAVRVWERMEQVSKGQPAEFLSTHPSHGTRIQQLEGWMNEALSYYKPQPGTPADLPPVSVR
ncbi:MAG: M48 family metallopeptidase [Nitrospirae bacterium]|nr:MAG: M48 family metallopeptidase [Nitrospirota bacterium]